MRCPRPLVVILGPTASGKTSLAIKIAREFNGEIICADSRTIYKKLDIGTAKPTLKERSQVKHWGIDIIEPDQSFSVCDFQRYALKMIEDIRTRGKTPFLVGGSGLYIDSVIYDYNFTERTNKQLRHKLQQLDINQLQSYCTKNSIVLPENDKNKRYLMNSIERASVCSNDRRSIIENCLVVGIATQSEVLHKRIEERADIFFRSGVVAEADKLLNVYSADLESMKSNIYKIFNDYKNGFITEGELKDRFITSDWHLAKKQLTWFKRNNQIKWLNLNEAEKYICDYLINCSNNVLE